MKKVIFYFLLILVIPALQSCFYGFENSVYGEGDVISETRTVKDFHGIDAAAGLMVFVEFGEMSNEIVVEADENLHEYIITEVVGGVLKIKTNRNIRNANEKSVYVKAGHVDFLEVSSAGKLIGENLLKTDRLSINVSSAGQMEIEMEAEDLDVDVSSSGEANLKGKCRQMDAGVSSAGDLEAGDLETEICNINVSSAGDAYIFVTAELYADASSAGNIRYKGEPETRKINKSSAGNVSGK